MKNSLKEKLSQIIEYVDCQSAANAGSHFKLSARVLHWFKDDLFRKLFKNAGIMLAGNITTAVLDLISLAVTARALGPEKFGILVLIFTYVKVVDKLINFQSWQAIIRYGAEAITHEQEEDFKRVVKFGTFLDAGSAMLAALLAAFGVFWISQWQNWGTETSQMARIFCITIVFNLVGTPTAVLRLFDRFYVLAMQRVAAAFLRAVCLAIAFLNKSSLSSFLYIWMFMYIFDYILLVSLGWRELHIQGMKNILKTNIRSVFQKFPGIIKFVLSTNLGSSIRLVAFELDILLVGAFLGAAPAGIFKVAKQFGSIPARFAEPLQQSIYPDMAKLWATGKVEKFRKFILRIGALSGILGIAILLVFVFAGGIVLDLTVGEEFHSAHGLLVVYMAAYAIFMFGVAFRPAVLSMEHAERILIIYSSATVIYTLSLFFLLKSVGVMGAAIAQIVFHSCWFIAMVFSISQFIQEHLKTKKI